MVTRKREYDAFEVDFTESRDRFSEGLDLLRTAWTKEEFTYNGRFYSIPEPITCLPRPVQKPHPPIYVACFSRPTVEMAAEQGFHTLFAPFAAAMMFGSVGAAVQTYKQLATVTVTRMPRSVRILPMLSITKRMNSERRSDYSTIYTPSCRRFLRIVPQRLRILPISLILLSDLKI